MTTIDAQLYETVGQTGSIHSMIESSLYRCQKSGLDAHMDRLPPVTKEMVERGKSHVSGHIHLMRRSTPLYYQNLTEILKANHTVLCYVYNNFDVFGRYGDQTLKDELKRINFCLGANLGETVIGTNAAVMSMRAPKGVWVIGDDHYIDVMKPYACYAYQIPGRYSRTGIGLLITRKENLTPDLAALFRFIESTELIITTGQASEDIFIKDTIVSMTYNKEQSRNVVLIVDNGGYITYANDRFYEMFHADPLTTINKALAEHLPEFGFVKSCLESGRKITRKRVFVGDSRAPEGPYYVDCTPVERDGEWIAVIVTLYRTDGAGKQENQGFAPKYTFDDLLGVSPKFVQLKTFAERIADTNSAVFIQGESGTGKELFAHAIHGASCRREKPFVSINCAALPKELIGSELFGYVGGAFTGANRSGAKGKFELADGGTLFLDEIGEMPLEMQSVLLRVLEENAVTRIGGDKPISINVRIITATNRDLQQYIADGKFRADLYYRLNVINLNMVPLRERKEDIPILAESFITRYAAENNVHIQGISQDALYALMDYRWPGNVRELRNVIERGVITAGNGYIQLRHLPGSLTHLSDVEPAQSGKDEPEAMGTKYVQRRREIALRLMQELDGNKTLVAKRMGISRSTLYRILRNEKA